MGDPHVLGRHETEPPADEPALGGSPLGIEYTTTDNGVRVYECDTWDDFIVKIRPHYPGKFVGGYIYRGHGHQDWKLSSQWERRLWPWKIDAENRGETDVSVKNRFFGPPEIRGIQVVSA